MLAEQQSKGVSVVPNTSTRSSKNGMICQMSVNITVVNKQDDNPKCKSFFQHDKLETSTDE